MALAYLFLRVDFMPDPAGMKGVLIDEFKSPGPVNTRRVKVEDGKVLGGGRQRCPQRLRATYVDDTKTPIWPDRRLI